MAQTFAYLDRHQHAGARDEMFSDVTHVQPSRAAVSQNERAASSQQSLVDAALLRAPSKRYLEQVASAVPICKPGKESNMNATLRLSEQIIGLDTTRVPVLLLATSANHNVPGRVIPEDSEAFPSLEEFRQYWNEHWRDSPVLVAVPEQKADPLGIRDWLQMIGQPLEPYELTGYRPHLRSDMTLRDLGIADDYRRPYVLALYACHRLQARFVVTCLFAQMLEVCSQLEETRHSLHRLAASLNDPVPVGFHDIPF